MRGLPGKYSPGKYSTIGSKGVEVKEASASRQITEEAENDKWPTNRNLLSSQEAGG